MSNIIQFGKKEGITPSEKTQEVNETISSKSETENEELTELEKEMFLITHLTHVLSKYARPIQLFDNGKSLREIFSLIDSEGFHICLKKKSTQ